MMIMEWIRQHLMTALAAGTILGGTVASGIYVIVIKAPADLPDITDETPGQGGYLWPGGFTVHISGKIGEREVSMMSKDVNTMADKWKPVPGEFSQFCFIDLKEFFNCRFDTAPMGTKDGKKVSLHYVNITRSLDKPHSARIAAWLVEREVTIDEAMKGVVVNGATFKIIPEEPLRRGGKP
jgi:hypothetical protein